MQHHKTERLKRILPANVVDQWDQSIVAAEKDNADNTISILDFIGSDWLGEGVTSKRIAAALRSVGDETDIVVNINSPGGEVEEGLAIFQLLKQHKGHVEVRILSMAASIASVIALAGDTVKMSKYGVLMVHDAWWGMFGNSRDLREAADHLDKVSERISQVYADKTGRPTQEMRALMQAGGSVLDGTYLTAEEALELGFIDGLLGADSVTTAPEKPTNLNPRKAIQQALQASGKTRSEAIALINEISGTRDAATPEGMRDAAETEAAAQAAATLQLALANFKLSLQK
mgnify:CR=1 FL=1